MRRKNGTFETKAVTLGMKTRLQRKAPENTVPNDSETPAKWNWKSTRNTRSNTNNNSNRKLLTKDTRTNNTNDTRKGIAS